MIDTIFMLLTSMGFLVITIWMIIQTKINRNNHEIHNLQTMAMGCCAELHKQTAKELGLMPKKERKRKK